MVGPAHVLGVDVAVPADVVVRRISDEADVRAMLTMQDAVFGTAVAEQKLPALLARSAVDDGLSLWVAEVNGRIVSAGRLEAVPGTDFAGIWGGATLEEWRGRGIYRAVTAARARSALALGKTFIHSDSTAYSRPILARSGLAEVCTATPYRWRR